MTNPEQFERLVARARLGLKDKFWGNGAIPDGTTDESIVLDAVEDVLLGRASWNPQGEADPYRRLADIVDSKIANLVRSFRNKKAKFLKHESQEPGAEDMQVATFLDEASEGTFMEKVKEKLKGSQDLLEYVEAASVFDTRREIAEVLGVDPSEVTNRQKRVRRVFAGLGSEFGIEL